VDNEIAVVVSAILSSSLLTALVTLFFTRRKTAAETNKTNAEAKSEEIESQKKVSDLLEKMQSEGVDLYRRNTELEKENTDQMRSIEILTARLEARDSQLAAATKQLDLLRDLAKDAPITETLRKQLEAMNQIIGKLQDAQSDGQKIMLEKERALQELLNTNRNLELQKPGKTQIESR